METGGTPCNKHLGEALEHPELWSYCPFCGCKLGEPPEAVKNRKLDPRQIEPAKSAETRPL